MFPPPLLLGHRGSRVARNIAENTVPSFDLALTHGCDGFEFDLRLTRDGCPVVCHPARLAGKVVSKKTCTQLPPLPHLEEVLRDYRSRAFLDMELKVSGLEAKILAALRKYMPEHGYVISSFLPSVLVELKARREAISVGIICEKPWQLVRWRKLPVEYVIVHKSLLNRRLVQRIHQAGQKVFVWTVNDKESMLRLAGWQVDGIISDNTRLLVMTLGRQKEQQETHI